MSYRVKILPRAGGDVQHIFDWLRQRSPAGADAWYAAFERAADNLVVNPTAYGLALENEHVEDELRQFLFKTRRGRVYRGIFTIVEKEVRILRVRGPGQPDLTADELALAEG